MKEWKDKFYVDIIKNERNSNGAEIKFLEVEDMEKVKKFHKSLVSYERTPLIRLKSLAEKLKVKEILVKDESYRFGLKAFKGLGGIYALSRVVCKKLGMNIEDIKFSDLKSGEIKEKISDMTFVTATDGNHGKGVAWSAAQLGCKAVVYMPKGSSETRAQAIRNMGDAEVTITDMGYDDTVRFASKMSEENGWYLVQDTSWEGYQEIPEWIIQGYTTMGAEAAEQMEEMEIEAPTHIFLQAGVGAMSGGIMGYLKNRYKDNKPVFAVVEPKEVACIYESARVNDSEPHAATGTGETIMAGLNCGEPCTVTWPILREYSDYYFSCPDFTAAKGMRMMANPIGKDRKIISGESGAVTLGITALLLEKKELEDIKEDMKLNENSIILLFSTEGDTDPEVYKSIIENRQNIEPEK